MKSSTKQAPSGRWYVVSSPKSGADLWRGRAESAAKAYENAAPALEKLARTASKPLAIRVQRSQNRILTDEISAVLHPGETVQDLTDHQIDVPQTTRDASDRRRDAQIEADVKIRLLEQQGLVEKGEGDYTNETWYDSTGQPWQFK